MTDYSDGRRSIVNVDGRTMPIYPAGRKVKLNLDGGTGNTSRGGVQARVFAAPARDLGRVNTVGMEIDRNGFDGDR